MSFLVLSATGTNYFLSHATIFQSDWSRDHNQRKMPWARDCYQGPIRFGFKVILNAPDPGIFNKKGKAVFRTNRKIRLIATSWSTNQKKGFGTYKWLDENLDFNKYEMTFVGRTPIEFRNIKHIEPILSKELAKELKYSDIFITATENDPCSNSLIESLHCGLPSVCLDSGGHREIVGEAGEFFLTPQQIPDLLKKVIERYTEYQSKIELPSIEEVGEQYYKYITRVIPHSSFGKAGYIMLMLLIFLKRLHGYIQKKLH